jgi:CBS domain-containing protein
MRKQVTHIPPDAPVEAAARLMRDGGIGFLPVCDLDTRVVGVVTDRDIVTRLHAAGRSASEVPVSSVMSTDVVACHPNDSLATAMTLLARKKKFRLVLVEESGRLAGVISITDLSECAPPMELARLMRAVLVRDLRIENHRSHPPVV